MPIYVAEVRLTEDADVKMQKRLVDAKNESKALQHITASHITIDRATPADLIALTKAGIEVEQAA